MVRAKQDRRLPAQQGRMFGAVRSTKPCSHVEIARNPNVREEALAELPVTVVHAVEQAPPRGQNPIERCVLTTLAVDSSDRAAEVLRSPGHEFMWHGYTRLTAMPKAYQLRDKIEHCGSRHFSTVARST